MTIEEKREKLVEYCDSFKHCDTCVLCNTGMCVLHDVFVDDKVDKIFNLAFPSDTHDPVNRPSHYTDGKIECIDYIQDKLTPDEFQGFCKGNALKYISRAGKKDPSKKVEDLNKAIWYLKRSIDALTGECND